MTAIDMFQLKLEYMIIMYVTYKTIDAVSLYIMFTHVYLILHIYVYTTINKSIMYTDTHVINDSMPDSHKWWRGMDVDGNMGIFGQHRDIRTLELLSDEVWYSVIILTDHITT